MCHDVRSIIQCNRVWVTFSFSLSTIRIQGYLSLKWKGVQCRRWSWSVCHYRGWWCLEPSARKYTGTGWSNSWEMRTWNENGSAWHAAVVSRRSEKLEPLGLTPNIVLYDLVRRPRWQEQIFLIIMLSLDINIWLLNLCWSIVIVWFQAVELWMAFESDNRRARQSVPVSDANRSSSLVFATYFTILL